MAHQSLYRMHRPATFAEVVGKEHITKPLEEAVKALKTVDMELYDIAKVFFG